MLNLLAAQALVFLSNAQPVLLRYKFHTGQSHSYRFNLNASVMTISMNMRLTVQSIARDGTATVETTVSDMKMNLNGKPMPQGKNQKTGPQKMSMRMTPTGHVSGLSGNGMAGPMGGLGGMQTANVLPQGPVSVGSRWTSTTDFATGKIQMHNALVSLQQSGGHLLATIRGTGSFDLSKVPNMMAGKGTMSGTVNLSMKYVFDATEGILRSLGGDVLEHATVTMQGQSHTSDVHSTLAMTLVH